MPRSRSRSDSKKATRDASPTYLSVGRLRFTATTPSPSKPGASACRLANVRTSSAAPTSRISENAISATTRAPENRLWAVRPGPPPGPLLRIISTFGADPRNAGTKPNTKPVASVMAAAIERMRVSTSIGLVAL